MTPLTINRLVATTTEKFDDFVAPKVEGTAIAPLRDHYKSLRGAGLDKTQAQLSVMSMVRGVAAGADENGDGVLQDNELLKAGPLLQAILSTANVEGAKPAPVDDSPKPWDDPRMPKYLPDGTVWSEALTNAMAADVGPFKSAADHFGFSANVNWSGSATSVIRDFCNHAQRVPSRDLLAVLHDAVSPSHRSAVREAGKQVISFELIKEAIVDGNTAHAVGSHFGRANNAYRSRLESPSYGRQDRAQSARGVMKAYQSSVGEGDTLLRSFGIPTLTALATELQSLYAS